MRRVFVPALFIIAACSAGNAAPSQPPSVTQGPSAPAAAASAGTTDTTSQTFAAVNGERAFEDLKAMVGFGPRPAGSPANQRTRAFIASQMKAIGLAATEQPFMAKTPVGQVAMANVIVTLPGKRAEKIVIGSHFDTMPTQAFTFVGANDGASSTALLMELARVLKDKPREFTYELVFFDGEEAWNGDWNSGNTWGSQYYVSAARTAGKLSSVKAMILLDMIGEKNVELRQDSNSTRWLNDIFWRTAGGLGHQKTFVAETTAIDDDHMPFIRAGIPAIDLIDLDYPAWHTANDTLDKVEPRSLKIVGDVVVAALPEVEKRLAAGR